MISIFEEDDAGFAPQPELYTVAGHIAHAADSVEWFVDGAFGERLEHGLRRPDRRGPGGGDA